MCVRFCEGVREKVEKIMELEGYYLRINILIVNIGVLWGVVRLVNMADLEEGRIDRRFSLI